MSRLHEKSGCPVIGEGTREIVIVNPSERSWTKHRFVFAFGAYGWTRLLGYGQMDDAFEACCEWLEDHAPGIFVTDSVNEEYQRAYAAALAEGLDEEDATERACGEAEVDVTSVCDGRHYLASWEWTIVAENPKRADLFEMVA